MGACSQTKSVYSIDPFIAVVLQICFTAAHVVPPILFLMIGGTTCAAVKQICRTTAIYNYIYNFIRTT